MELIRKKGEEYFEAKGGKNFKRLSGLDISHIFDLYDTYIFGNHLREAIKDKRMTIAFYSTPRTSGLAGVCSFNSADNKLYLDVSLRIIDYIVRAEEGSVEGSVETQNRLSALLYVIGLLICDMLIILWGGDLEDSLRSKLRRCLMDKYFRVPMNAIFEIPLTIETFGEGEPTPKRGFGYWENSCYLDSVLIVIFLCASDFWTRKMLYTDLKSMVYIKLKSVICTATTSINTDVKFMEYAVTIQDELRERYEDLTDPSIKSRLRCVNIRKLLRLCVPSIHTEQGWVMYNDSSIYASLADIFPNIGLDIPVQITRKLDNGTFYKEPIKYENVPFLHISDYILKEQSTKGGYHKKIRWDLVATPVLVFYNTGAPRLKDLDETGIEEGYTLVGNKKFPFKEEKIRAFGLSILDHYELIGITTLHGVQRNREGGAHYTAYFLGGDTRWYHYDDLSDEFEVAESLPKDIFKERVGNYPSLFFYKKV